MPGSRAGRARPGVVAAALLATVAIALAACGDAPPTPSPGPSGLPALPTAPPREELPLPDEDASLEQVLLRNAAGRFDRYASIGQLQGAPASCTAVLLDTGAGEGAPAHAITSGHCLGLSDPNEVLQELPAEGMAVAFDWFVDTPEHAAVPVDRIAWASMRGTDLAVLRLDATYGELGGAGLQGWRPQAIQAGGSLDAVMLGVPVGLPLVDIPEDERYLRLGTCSLDAEPVRLNERQWVWPRSLRNDCPQVLPGNSGSAVLDAATGGLVGIMNTTTYKGEQGAECWLGRPCEAAEDGEVSLPDTSYAQPVAGVDGCFDDQGAFATGDGCPLGPAGARISGAPLATNPGLQQELPGLGTPPTTWSATIGGDGITHYRWKAGPLGTLDCAGDDGWSDPAPVSEPIDAALPTVEQRLLLCVVGGPSATPDAGWQAPADASTWATYIDTTPPAVSVRFDVSGNARKGWRIAPVFNPPEISFYLVKGGPARTTDCDDPAGYAPYRRVPLDVAPEDAPFRYCAIGADDANNTTKPAFRMLK